MTEPHRGLGSLPFSLEAFLGRLSGMPWEMVLHSGKLLGMEEPALDWVCGSFLVSDCG